MGLVDKSLRNIKDGNTYFGILSPNDEKNDNKIDFSTGNSSNLDESERQFCIRFDLDENCYMIKDCSYGSGYGPFMKLVKEMKIKDNTLINIGNNYIVFTLGVDELEPNEDEDEDEDNIDEEIEKVLSVKVFRGELINYSYVFNESQINKIYIGNNESCNIVLNDNVIDDIHCSIEYNKERGWILNDGYNNKKSEI